MAHYAENTTVSVEKSRAEIETTLTRYGATAFQYGWNQTKASIAFSAQDRMVRFVLPLPDPDDRKFTHKKPSHNSYSEVRCTPLQQSNLYQQACRQRWRALALAIKAKLEAVASGISLFEQEFLAHIVDPATNRTVYESISQQLRVNYESDEPRALMLEYRPQEVDHGDGGK